MMIGSPRVAGPAPSDASETRAALGAGFVLLASVFGSFTLAYALSLTIGGIYVPFLMPLVVGLLLGTIGSFVARRFALLERRPVVLSALLGATIAYLGYHALAYLRVLDLLAAQWSPELVIPPGVEPAAAALLAMEKATGEQGFLAYLAFVSQGSGVVYSPLGLLGRAEPGLVTTLVVAVAELGVTMATAVYAMLWRTHARPRQGVFARIDEAALMRFREALRAADWAGAGTALASSTGPAQHAIVLESAGGATRLIVHALGPDGRPRDIEESHTIGEAQATVLAASYRRGASV